MALLAQHSISVVFPAYNEKENIAKAVAQAVDCLDDLFEDWEIIIVDDGSRDGTGAIIDGLAAQDPRLVAVHHPRNEGYGAALRSGIQRARRDLIFFADSDLDRKSTRLNSSHQLISYAVFCLKKKNGGKGREGREDRRRGLEGGGKGDESG